MRKNSLYCLSLLLMLSALVACAKQPQPDNVNDICAIFTQYPDWHWATQDVESRWGIPPHVQMAIIYQESSFHPQAKPEREKLLGFIPWKRPSSAKGYPQALSGTWQCYKDCTGNYWVSRHRFADAADFIGWYSHRANQQAGISKQDAYSLYLAYHEGIGGYQRRTYQSKQWLLDTSRRVESRAATYRNQLRMCQSSLKKKPWYQFWS